MFFIQFPNANQLPDFPIIRTLTSTEFSEGQMPYSNCDVKHQNDFWEDVDFFFC